MVTANELRQHCCGRDEPRREPRRRHETVAAVIGIVVPLATAEALRNGNLGRGLPRRPKSR